MKALVPVVAKHAALELDDPISRSLSALGRAIGVWHALEPLLTEFIPVLKEEVESGQRASKYFSRKTGKEVSRNEWVREVAGDLVTWSEKLSRTVGNMTKVVDEASRLRQHLTGNDGARPDLEAASDGELISLLVEVVIARGLWRRVQSRAKELGVVLEGEIVDG